MTQFLNATLHDMRSGRESWRVVTVLGTMAFALSLAVAYL